MTPTPQLVPTRRRTTPTTSRRSLLHAAGHAAWAAPFISMATAAPAAAATSLTGGPGAPAVQTVSGQYWVLRGPGTRSGVVPAIVLANPTTSPMVGLRVSLFFPSSRFSGVVDNPQGGPALPAVAMVGDGLGDGWSAPTVDTYAAGVAPSGIVVSLTKDSLDAGAATAIGDPTRVTGVELVWRGTVGAQPIPWTSSVGADPSTTTQGELTYLGTTG